MALRLGLFVFFCHSVQAAGKVLQYSIFLSDYGRGAIAQAFFLSAMVVAGASLGLTGLVRRVRRRVLVSGTLLSVALLGAFWRWALQTVGWSGFAVYLFIEAASLLSVVVAWNVVNSACDPRQARRVIPVVGLGASGAFLVNGLVISPLVRTWLAPRDVVWFVVAAAVAAAVVYFVLDLESGAEEGGRAGRAQRDSEELSFWEGVGRGLSNLWNVKLLRVFTVATILMIVAQQFLNFVFLSSLQVRFSSRELAEFLGWFVALLGVSQAFAQALVSSRVLTRLGGAAAAALGPGVISGGALLYVVFLPSFWALVGLRFVDRLLKVAFYSPAIQSLYTPVSRQTKLAAMALIKGVVSPAAYGAAAVGLMGFGRHLDDRALLVVVALTAGVCAVWLVSFGKKAYVAALESALSKGSFSLDSDLQEGFHVTPDKMVIQACRKAVREGGQRQGVFALRLLSDFPISILRPVLDEAFSSPHALVRRESAHVVLEHREDLTGFVENRLLADSDGEVVALGIRALVALPGDATLRTKDMLSDPRPLVRACAALTFLRTVLGETEEQSQEADPNPGIGAGDSDEGHMAVEVLDALVGSPASGDRMDFARAVAIMEERSSEPFLAPLLEDEDMAVRSQALQAVGALRSVRYLPALVANLAVRPVQSDAVEALSKLGPELYVALGSFVDDEKSSEDALVVVPSILAQREESEAADMLWRLLSHASGKVRFRAARMLWRRPERPSEADLEHVVIREAVHGYRYAGIRAGLMQQGLAPRAFFRELDHLFRQVSRRVVAVTGLLFPRDVAEAVWNGLERGSSRHRAGAVELIDQLCPPRVAAAVVGLLEGVAPPFPAEMPGVLREAYEQGAADPRGEVARLSDVELKWFLCYELGGVWCLDGISRDDEMRSFVEKMLFFKGVGIFAELSGEELRRVAEISEDVSLPAGRTIFRRGDPGDAMYLILDGVVEIIVDSRTVAELGAGECFGEMALLDAEPRSADARSGTDVELLKIRGEDFDDLLDRKHEIAKGILRVLTARLRRANIGAVEKEQVGPEGSDPSVGESDSVLV